MRRQQAELSLLRAQLTLAEQRRQLALSEHVKVVGAWRDANREIDLFQEQAAIRMLSDSVARKTAEARLERALAGNSNEQIFAKAKHIFAPADGIIVWRQAWNDMARVRARLDRDFVVWNGLVLGDVVPIDRIGVEVELPESLYGQWQVGDELTVQLTDYPGLQLTAEIVSIGEEFRQPDDLANSGRASARRVFTVTARMAIPLPLQGRLLPGAKAEAMKHDA